MTTGRELSLIVEANISRATGAPDTSIARGRKSAWTLGREHLGILSELIKVRLEVFEANSTISENDIDTLKRGKEGTSWEKSSQSCWIFPFFDNFFKLG